MLDSYLFIVLCFLMFTQALLKNKSVAAVPLKKQECQGLSGLFEFIHSACPDYQSWVITCKSH